MTFYDGVTILGTQTLGGGGQATLYMNLLGSGVRWLRAFYGGGANYAASGSVIVRHVYVS